MSINQAVATLTIVPKMEHDATLSKLLSQTHSLNTLKAYNGQVNVAKRRGLDIDNLTDYSLARYVAFMMDNGAAYASAYNAVKSLNWYWKERHGQKATGPLTEKALQGFHRDHEAQQRGYGQVDGITWKMADRVCKRLDQLGTLPALRDSMIFGIMSDALLRASEMVNVRVEDILREPNGSGMVIIRRSKTDQYAAGDTRYLRSETLERIDTFLETVGITSGHIAVRFHSNRHTRAVMAKSQKALKTPGIRQLTVRRMNQSGYRGRFGSHSFRVGSAQELARNGAGDIEIMRAGGWKRADTAARYTRNVEAGRSAMARLRG